MLQTLTLAHVSTDKSIVITGKNAEEILGFFQETADLVKHG